MAKDLPSIAAKITANSHAVTKPASYYPFYAQYLDSLRDSQISLMEVGVFTGESLKVWAEYLPEASIIGVDLEDRQLDFSAYPAIRFEQANQIDTTRLVQICNQHAPEGLDVVIDDASHIGAFSRITFSILFPRLNSNGYYFVEDWGTGYWDDWVDGSRYQRFEPGRGNHDVPLRIPSHDSGMVGFVKELLDEVHADSIRNLSTDPAMRLSSYKFFHAYSGLIAIQKA
jgi:hypothetical protein